VQPDSALAAATTLVTRFRRHRPLRGGSLIITVFGDAIAPRGGAITLGSLIPLMQPFGLNERLVRTSVARLADDEWLTNRRCGRLSEYRLSAHGRRRFLDATRRIYGGPAAVWNGRWTLVLLPERDAARRQKIREALRWEGFGEPRPGLLAHPTLTPSEARQHLAAQHLGTAPLVLESRTHGYGTDRQLLRAGWDLRDLAARYARFIAGFAPVLAALPRRTAPPPPGAFIVRTLLIHEYRKIHLRDPLLPQSLLPRDWPGTAAHDLCRSLYERVLSAAEEHLTQVAARLDGTLPPPDAALYSRFAD
jgi:phenylacetic acid degradation operon negative regulatory protein